MSMSFKIRMLNYVRLTFFQQYLLWTMSSGHVLQYTSYEYFFKKTDKSYVELLNDGAKGNRLLYLKIMYTT